MSDNIHKRFTVSASGAPALVVCLQLDQAQAARLLEWYNTREKELMAEKWKSWGPAEMALRTLCIQIEYYGPAAFRRAPTLFDESLAIMKSRRMPFCYYPGRSWTGWTRRP